MNGSLELSLDGNFLNENGISSDIVFGVTFVLLEWIMSFWCKETNENIKINLVINSKKIRNLYQNANNITLNIEDGLIHCDPKNSTYRIKCSFLDFEERFL